MFLTSAEMARLIHPYRFGNIKKPCLKTRTGEKLEWRDSSNLLDKLDYGRLTRLQVEDDLFGLYPWKCALAALRDVTITGGGCYGNCEDQIDLAEEEKGSGDFEP